MLPFSSIVKVLESITAATRRTEKEAIVSAFLTDLPIELISPSVRLLMGELWPSWERREMGVGPETIIEVLADLSPNSVETISSMRKGNCELGALGEILLRHKSQHALSQAELDTKLLYDRLCRISEHKGYRSHYRKQAVLRGIFLEATPIEVKYIIRAILGNMMVGLGPSLMTSAIGAAFDTDPKLVRKAYMRMPDIGMIALLASKGALDGVRISPPTPVRPMLIGNRDRIDDLILQMPGAACLVKYGGLRVQMHKVGEQFFVYTKRLKDITPALQELAEEALEPANDLIAEGELLLISEGKILPKSEVVRHINRRHRIRRRRAYPSLIIRDLLFIGHDDITGLGFKERRQRLAHIFKKVELDGSSLRAGVFLSGMRVLEDQVEADKFHRWILSMGFEGLLVYDVNSPYTPGEQSRCYVVRCIEGNSNQGAA
jgi:DNA ligase-1